MARSIRLEFEGAFFHVMARGNRRKPIFLGNEDRRWFLQTLGEACAKIGWRVHAWVLLRDTAASGGRVALFWVGKGGTGPAQER